MTPKESNVEQQSKTSDHEEINNSIVSFQHDNFELNYSSSQVANTAPK